MSAVVFVVVVGVVGVVGFAETMKCLFIILGVVVCSSLLVRGEGVDFEKPFFDFQTPSFLGEEERERVKGLFWRGDVNGEGEEKVAR